MWFTRVSIKNPVLATMVMLAFVVFGIVAVQRLKVDQFPNVEFPTVVIAIDYPSAAPEIVETEVTRKVEEAVNTIAGINQLYSRSYEGTSVVIVQFNLDVDGRKAADDVREKLALVKATFRDEVKEPRVSRFDPSARPIYTLAVTSPDGSRSQQALTAYADQTIKKRLENVRGVGAGDAGGQRQARDQHLPRPRGDGSAGRERRAGDGCGAHRKPGTARRRDPLARHRPRGAGAGAHERPARLWRPDRRAPRCGGAATQPVRLSQVAQRSSTAPKKPRPSRCTTASAPWRWTCRRARAKTPSRWSTA